MEICITNCDIFAEAGSSSNFTLEGLSTADVIEEEEGGDAIADLFSDFEASIGEESQDRLEQVSNLGSSSYRNQRYSSSIVSLNQNIKKICNGCT